MKSLSQFRKSSLFLKEDVRRVLPYIIVTIGIIGDAITTHVGLTLGHSETYPEYAMWKAMGFFYGLSLAFSFVQYFFRDRKILYINSTVSCCSLYGFVSNSLVIYGILHR